MLTQTTALFYQDMYMVFFILNLLIAAESVVEAAQQCKIKFVMLNLEENVALCASIAMTYPSLRYFISYRPSLFHHGDTQWDKEIIIVVISALLHLLVQTIILETMLGVFFSCIGSRQLLNNPVVAKIVDGCAANAWKWEHDSFNSILASEYRACSQLFPIMCILGLLMLSMCFPFIFLALGSGSPAKRDVGDIANSLVGPSPTAYEKGKCLTLNSVKFRCATASENKPSPLDQISSPAYKKYPLLIVLPWCPECWCVQTSVPLTNCVCQ